MLKRLLTGVSSIVALLLIAGYTIPIYADICEKDEYTGKKDCAPYHIPTYLFWHLGEFLNSYGGAITAVATAVIGYFTYTLYKSSIEQATLTRDSIQLARDEFNTAHRPKLVAREVSIFWVMTQAEVGLVIINEGDATAHDISCEFYIKDVIIMEKVATSKHRIDFTDNPIPTTIAPGEFTKHKGTVTVDIPTFLTTADSEPKVRCLLSFEGFASYAGNRSLKRRSAYYRPWNTDTPSFVPSDDPDKEYPG